MFANYLVNLVGQFTGRKLSLPLPGASANDLLNLPDSWMKNISGERLLFGYFILSCRRKSNWLERILVKNHHDDGAKRACIVLNLCSLNLCRFDMFFYTKSLSVQSEESKQFLWLRYLMPRNFVPHSKETLRAHFFP